ncbi:hypothetical protein EPI10_016809 [Gossypium australe]|uniref:Uncharacterized protein n=1 Tax=Gossypium australe TaxID=47621 RepID=A0A5B6VQ25_9ROSI|nr:hypothetical protein EPI10_016809 [Gossypium australe]
MGCREYNDLSRFGRRLFGETCRKQHLKTHSAEISSLHQCREKLWILVSCANNLEIPLTKKGFEFLSS